MERRDGLLGQAELRSLVADGVYDISYRQLDYYCRVGAMPATGAARGSGSQRRFTMFEVELARVVAILTKHRAGVDVLRRAVVTLREHPELWAGPVMVGGDGEVRRWDARRPMTGAWMVDLVAVRSWVHRYEAGVQVEELDAG